MSATEPLRVDPRDPCTVLGPGCALCRVQGFTQEESADYAKLFASAPGFLFALREIAFQSYDKLTPDAARLRTIARRAIEKFEGRS